MLRTRTPTCVLTSAAAPRTTHGHDPDRYVQIGSLTKVLTGTAFIRMVAAGLLDAADPVERWLPAPRGTGITLQHLAEHTSGLPRQPPGLPSKDPYRGFDTAALHRLLARCNEITVAPAGTTEEYSNLGYAVLGAALSAAAQLPYEQVIDDHVLSPLGIREIAAHPPTEQCLHPTGLFGRKRPEWTLDGAILPSGGLWATPRATADLLKGLLVDRKLGDPAPTWQTTGLVTWHNGATGTSSAFAGALPGGAWVLIHRIGGTSSDTDRMGVELLRNLHDA
ncbi:serine hydrolase domain-containing protein [Streptomyces sp. NPDC032472]|uniref:serine hydrolase domain-containing protein n=1 Tax=Streptomyces sp. NPDC032472 TaxID=3155018 RepID=UPI0033F5DA01